MSKPIKIPRLFEFLVFPALLWISFIGWIFGVEIQTSETFEELEGD